MAIIGLKVDYKEVGIRMSALISKYAVCIIAIVDIILFLILLFYALKELYGFGN